MTNIKLNVHDHLTSEEMHQITKSFYDLANAYQWHIRELTMKYPDDAAVAKEIKRAKREAKKANAQGDLWAERWLTSKSGRAHYDCDYI